MECMTILTEALDTWGQVLGIFQKDTSMPNRTMLRYRHSSFHRVLCGGTWG